MTEEISLGKYDTEDEAAYAYNVAKLIVEPDCSPNALNHGMHLTEKQKADVEAKVRLIMILVP